MRHDRVGQFIVLVPVPDSPPGNLFKPRRPSPSFRPALRLSHPYQYGHPPTALHYVGLALVVLVALAFAALLIQWMSR
jgi:hypothetical protein